MFGHTFKGGIHPYDGKELSKDKAISSIFPKGDLVYPLSQHIGAPAVPIVEKGEHVLVGQKIAEAGGFVSAPIHASVSGTVKGVEKHLTVTGNLADCIVIENDGKYEEIVWPERKPLEQMTPKEILEIVKEAGIVGMGGAGFPTHVKLSPKEPEKIDYVIANCAECEPYLTSDYRRMIENPELLVGGMKVLLQIFPQAKGVIAVEDNKSEAIAILRRHLPDWPGVELAVLPTRYPQGAEKQLIQAVTGRQVPPGHLPFSVGCAVFNAGTVAAVYRAVYEGKPVTKRIVTVTGEGVKEPKNLIVRIGTPFAQVIEAAGGLTEDACKVLSGGPMMGTAQGELAAPVLKGTNAVLCLTSANPTPERPVCIRCSKCVEVCPMHLQPLYLYRYEAAGNLDALQALHVTDCIECGCCSYTCPGQLPLTERFRAAKQALKEGIRP